jgi:DNA-directed RNA polymerase specialized sigma subunit
MPKLNEYTKSKADVPPEYTSWQQAPSDDSYATLMKKLDPIISSGTMSFGGPGLEIRSRILVDKALHTFDPSKGASLNTHVYNNLKGLNRYKAQRASAVHTPERGRLDKNHIYHFEKGYHDTHGVLPSDQTIADHLRISKKRVGKARIGGESPEIFSEKGDQLTAGSARSADSIWMDYVHHDLDDINKKVFEWTTGHNGSELLKKHEIAKRLGITAPAVSSRISTISKKLEEGMDDGTRNLR